MSTLFIHQSYASVQKIDSREGLSCCKRGVICERNKMNIYLMGRHLHPFWGYLLLNVVQYAAKYSAFCTKTHCILVQNAR